jgi:teichuronic acid biosynthesis glycosyltransferase TuaG
MKSLNPQVSVIITYYKKKNYILKTVNSILNQTYKNFEVIFVYDDKDKKDLNYVKKILKKLKQKKLIINKRNLGVAKSRNKALKFCKGLFIAFIDADDIWKKKKLEFQIKYMLRNNLNFSCTSYDVIDDKGKIIRSRKVPNYIKYDHLIKSNFIGLSTVVYRKNIHSKIKFPNLNTQEDFALWLSLLRKGVKLNTINKNLSFWRKTKNSLSSNIFQKLKDAFKLFYRYENKNFILSIFSVIIISYNKILKNI